MTTLALVAQLAVALVCTLLIGRGLAEEIRQIRPDRRRSNARS